MFAHISRYAAIAFALAVIANITTTAGPRIWTNKTGEFSVEAELVERLQDSVVPRRTTGGTVSAPIARRSNANHVYLQSIEEVDRERRIIVDATKSGGTWWFPQRRDFRSDQPHQGKVLADYLRSRGCEVIELPRRTVLDDQLKGADMVIRVPNFSTYSDAELQAYRDYVATGGSLLLVGGAANPRAAPDAVANAFGIEISDVLSRVRVTRWAEDPYLRQLPFMSLMRGGRISRSPEEFIPWGWDVSNNLIVGSVAYGKGKVVALSTPWFIDSHQQALPLTDYILHQLIDLPLNQSRLTGVAQPRRQSEVAAQQSGSRPKTSAWPPRKAILLGHRRTIMSVAFSPDGTTLATASWDGTVKLWSIEDGQPAAKATLDAFPNVVNTVAYSANGKYLAASGWRDGIKLWSLPEGSEIARLRGDGTDFGIYDLAISPDGKTLAVACSDKTIKLWNAESLEFEASLLGHTHFVQALAFSPDGRFLASGCFDHGVKLWDVRTRKEHATLSPGAFDKSMGHQGPVNDVVFSSDSATLVTSSEDSTVKLWDVAKGTLRNSLETAPGGAIALAISPDNSLLAAAGGGLRDDVKLWRLATGEELAEFRAHVREVRAIAFSPDSTTLATGSLDQSAKLWDVKMVMDWWKGRPVVRKQEKRPAEPSVAPSEALEALESPDFDTRFRAAVTLARAEGGDAMSITSILIEAVENKSLSLVYRARAIVLLGLMKSEKELVTPVLVAAMDDDDPMARRMAAEALTRLGPDARSAIPALIEKLKSTDNTTRAEAAQVLAGMQKEAAPALPVLLDVLVKETHTYLARQQERFRKSDGYRPSDRNSYDARAEILQAIAAINPPIKGSDPRLLPALGFARTAGADHWVMPAFQKIYPFALGGRISHHWLPPDPGERERLAHAAVPLLVKMLDDKDRSLQAAAIKILGDTGAYAEAAGPALKEKMKDSDRLVSVAAAQSLMQVDRKNTISVPFLIDSLNDSDPEARDLREKR